MSRSLMSTRCAENRGSCFLLRRPTQPGDLRLDVADDGAARRHHVFEDRNEAGAVRASMAWPKPSILSTTSPAASSVYRRHAFGRSFAALHVSTENAVLRIVSPAKMTIIEKAKNLIA